jgi:hypothetical protein
MDHGYFTVVDLAPAVAFEQLPQGVEVSAGYREFKFSATGQIGAAGTDIDRLDRGALMEDRVTSRDYFISPTETNSR